MAVENKIPKGPSNSVGMGATPGTQQTAINNVTAGGINPNMPIAPQLAKQGASSFQQSVMKQAAPKPPVPTPVSKTRSTPVNRMAQFAPSPVVSSAQMATGS